MGKERGTREAAQRARARPEQAQPERAERERALRQQAGGRAPQAPLWVLGTRRPGEWPVRARPRVKGPAKPRKQRESEAP